MAKYNQPTIKGIDEDIPPDYALQFAQNVRMGMAFDILKENNGVMPNTTGNRMLLDSISMAGAKQRELGNDDKNAETAARSAEAIISMFQTVGNNNPIAQQQAVAAQQTHQLDLSKEDDVDIIEGEASLGNNVLSVEETGAFN